MKTPDISWYITDEFTAVNKDYFCGTYSPNLTDFSIKLQVWNNKFGQEEAQTIDEPLLKLTFTNIEDTKLLEYCTVTIDNNTPTNLDIVDNIGSILLGRPLEGAINNGEDTMNNNYCDIVLTFTLNKNMKNGLKNLIVDLQYN